MTREQVLAQLGAIGAICDALAASLVQDEAPAEGSVLAQLGAIGAICDALAASLVQDEAPAEGSAPACAHPEGLRKDASTLRGPRQYFCQQCKAIVDEASGAIVG